MCVGADVALELSAGSGAVPEDVGAVVAGAALVGTLPAGGFVGGLPAAGMEEFAVESDAGCTAAGVPGAPATPEAGALEGDELDVEVGFDAGGNVVFASVLSELGTVAGLFAFALKKGSP